MSENNQIAICNSVSIPMNNEFLLWHYRLEHLDFQYFKYLFSSMFSNKTINFKYENCKLVKHQHIPFFDTQY